MIRYIKNLVISSLILLSSCGNVQSPLNCKEQSLSMGNTEISSYGCDNNLDGEADESWVTIEKNDGETIECKLKLNDGDIKKISCDYNADGTPEFEFEGYQIFTEFEPLNGELTGKIYVFDSEGNYKEYSDNGLNGKIDTIEGFYVDDQGNIIKYASDKNANGIAERIDEYEYNNDNELVKQILKIDSDDNGKLDEITTWYYNNQGNLTKFTSAKNANGIAEKIQEYKFNKDGGLVKKTLKIDSDEDGKYESIVVNEYDLDGKLVKSTTDGEGGLCVFNYINDDILKSFTCDHDKDGEVDFISEKLFDSDGNVVQEMDDNNGDGNPERVVEHEYDSEGNLLHSKTYCDYNSDGEIDKVYDKEDMCF